jgi:hypothetical protein
VGHVVETHREPADREPLARHREGELGEVGHVVLGQLVLEQRQGERRPDHGHGPTEVLQQVRERAHVVLVAVSEHHGGDVVRAAAHVFHVRQHQVDARHVGGGEREPHVEDQQTAVDLQARHVAAHLTDPAEEHEAG